ncbi:T9SS type A sorting domain-containing protein [Candidatus Poribacteria bacterium]|nr:T9SS type A sorting domain-containing protein [Candidatus Poribacteria bacterium]
MCTNKNVDLSLKLLLLTTTLVASMISTGFHQAFAGEDCSRGIIVTSGSYTADKEYTMKARGKDYYCHETHDGDWLAGDLPNEDGIRLADCWVKYIFKVPANFYDQRLIQEFRVKMEYDNVDFADVGGNDNTPPKFYCYDRQYSEWDKWFDLEDAGDGEVKSKTVTTPDVYKDDPEYHIVAPGGAEEYQIHLKVDAPDGDGGAPGDDDAEVDIDRVHVILVLKQHDVPAAPTHKLPTKGSNDKVNVPLNENTKFTVEAATLSATGYPTIEYHWKKLTATAEPPSVNDEFDYYVTVPETNINFSNTGDYKVYCKVVYKKDPFSGKMKDMMISNVQSIPVRVWNRPTVFDKPPQSAIDSGDVSWYNNKYVGLNGQPVRLMADGSAQNGGAEGETITKYLWDFENNDTFELEQPAGQVASYTWNNPAEGPIRCKAETNYGIRSDWKPFSSMKVYDILSIDPGGPYTGRPNKSVSLSGSINTNSYPKSTVKYQWRVNSSTPAGVLKGSAISKGDYIELTPNATNRNGQVEYTDLPLSDDFSVTGEFWSGGGNGADAFYIYIWATGTPTNEDDAKGHYCIAYDEYTDQIQLKRNGANLKVISQTIPIDNSQWRPFRVTFYKGKFKVYLDNNLKLEYDDGTNYQPLMSNRYCGFGARTGSQTNFHRVRNMEWTPGDPVYTDNGGKAENTWTADGTYRVGFTAMVTTPEGLTFEDTAFADVTVESGRPTAMPGGPYRGGIAGGNFSPVQFEGNHPDFVEADDIGHIKDWTWILPDGSNKGLKLDGKDDYVIVNPVSEFPTNALTVEFWMKSSDESREGTPISYASTADDNDLLIYNYQSFNIHVAGTLLPTQTSANDGYWHHIAVTWQSSDGQLKFYKDGVEVATGTIAQGLELGSGGSFVVGQEQDAVGGNFNRSQAFAGVIDEVRVWNKVRSTEEIRKEMGAKLTGNESDLALYWKFEEGQGSTVSDESPSGNDGNLVVTSDDPDPNKRWVDDGQPEVARGVWNPNHSYPKAGEYGVGLTVQSEYGKWSSTTVSTQVEVIDGVIAGYIRAADLRTPVREIILTLTSSHVDKRVLNGIAAESNGKLWTTNEGGLQTQTDGNGYYAFEDIPLGSYRISAHKGEGDDAHEFETRVQATELTLNGPNQLAIDFVDLSVFPVGGRIAYSIQKNEKDVYVDRVSVTAQPVGSTSVIEALPSTTSLSATGVNYSMPLFAGKYLFLAKLSEHDIRIKKETPGYDYKTGLVTIEGARTDVDFIDYTTHQLTVNVVDSGGYAITQYPDTGNPILVTISGRNGQVSDAQLDENGQLEVTLNPGEYTVTVAKADPESQEIDLTGTDGEITMTVPIKIELSIGPKPKLLDVPAEFLEQFGMTEQDNPEGYMYYYPPEPRKHEYTIKATANGQPVKGFTLFVTDEVSMTTEDPPTEQQIDAGEEVSEVKYTIIGGLPKKTDDDPPLAAPKKIRVRAIMEGYLDSDTVEDEVTVLGEVAVGTAAKIVSVPIVNYTVLHDPPGDGSNAYLDDSMTIKGLVAGLQVKLNDVEIPVYPSPWRTERKIKDFEFEKDPDSETEFKDLKDKGLLGYRNSDPTLGHFTWAAVVEAVGGAYVVSLGPGGYAIQLVKMGVKAAAITPVSVDAGIVQFEVSPSRHLETPSGDELPDLLGPGKGDIYFGEGWTLGLQTKYRLGIKCTERDPSDNCLGWELFTEQVETYDILERTNQYIYTTRDIENIIADLTRTIDDPDADPSQKEKLQTARGNWQELLNNNYAYEWYRDYLREDGVNYGKSLDEFLDAKGLSKKSNETLIFSAGPTFEYSRKISASNTVSFSTELSIESTSEYSNELETSIGTVFFGTGTAVTIKFGSSASIGSSTGFGAEWESGYGAEQTVGFKLSDDDIGDNIATRVYTDPRWGTPLFFAEPGSITSDPWEQGTNKGIDVTLELLEESTGPFDYEDGANYKVKVTYTGMRGLNVDRCVNCSFIFNFELFTVPTMNPDHAYVEFDGYWGPFTVSLDSVSKSAIVDVAISPPGCDLENNEEKEYSVDIMAQRTGDPQIIRTLTLKPKFADLRAPRAVITAPYDGERVSPVFYAENPFKIEVVSEDTDLKTVQLQIRSKQPDGVWEPWSNLPDMVWEDGGENPNVTVLYRPDRRPPRTEFTFKWSDAGIRSLGVGEYALRAVATDKATRISLPNFSGNTDLDPPFVTFLVDDSKPSVLNTIPDYQTRESERIYRGELSVTFTDDMRATDFDDRTFYVTDLLDNNKKVAGYVSYSPALRKVVFVPIVPFQPNGYYRVGVKTDTEKPDGTTDRGVHDLAGNPLDNAFSWTFRTTDAPFEPIWAMNFRVNDGIATDANNIAAVEYGALDEEDESDEKDARAVPGLALQLRMNFLNPNKVQFERDIRPADGRLAHHWFFEIVNAQEYSTVTLEWQPSVGLTKTTRQYQVIRLVEFDANGDVSNTVTLDPTLAGVDPETGEVEFVQAYSYVNQGETTRHFRLDVQKVSFVAGEFENGTSGWKFFSVPITPQRAEPFVNLGDDIDPFQLYQYDTKLGGYKIYPLDIGEVGLQTGHGYFTRLRNDVNADVGGSSNHDDVTLTMEAAGWHAIGNPFIKEVSVSALLVNGQAFDSAVAAGLVEGNLYRWDVVTPSEAYQSEYSISDSYQPVTSSDTLNPWEGYWLKTKQENLTLTIPVPPDLPDTPPTPDYLKPRMAPSEGERRQAKGESIVAKGQFDLKLALISDIASDLTTTLGTHPKSKVGLDELDSAEPPILGETIAAYFKHTDWKEGADLYNHDYQPPLQVGESRTWQLTVYADKSETSMTLSWEDAIAQVPDDIILSFRPTLAPSQEGRNRVDKQSEWQDMRQVRSVKLNSGSLVAKLQFEIRAERFEMSPPSDVQVIAGERLVTLQWKAEDNPFIEGYVIEREKQVDRQTRRFELAPKRASVPACEFPPRHEFVDTDVEEEATYTYQLTVRFKSGAELNSERFTVTVLPFIEKTVLLPCYPNPFNPDVWIPYELAREASVSIEIYNVAGQLVRTLALSMQPRGRYIQKGKAAYWDGRTEFGERAASGLYFYVLKAGNFTATRKMVILK